ncbi:MAG TPA: branched-chain amino acid aminotransferase [Candidatus Acidoferrum sp.]|nr:branched-chain amino acid aminotransferase [Candidatus Acidoferrum sp.]
MSPPIPVTRVSQSRLTEALRENSEFGSTFSDHMLVADWEADLWRPPQIVPFGPISFSPALTPFHYGQAIFEGFKAHRTPDDSVALFRPRENFSRLNRSAARLAMPEIPEALFLDGVTQLVRLDRDWVPHREGGSLYVRPVYFGVDDTLLVRPANRYRLIVMACPVGPYFSQPIRLLAEERFVRAFPGGTGDSKAAGNYAGGLLAARLAQEKGFHNVLWLDGTERRYVEESGVMNVFFVLDGAAITPPLGGTILPGVTRDSALTLFIELGIPVQERRISMDELLSAHAAGKLTEGFGVGTAAIVAPIACIRYRDRELQFPPAASSSVAARLRSRLVAIQTGREPDRHNWLLPV